MRAAAALRHGSGRRNVSYRDLPARHRSRALESRLCAAITPAEGRPLRRESKPAAALLPVPGGAEAIPGRDPGDLPGFPQAPGDPTETARHPLLRGRLRLATRRPRG